MRCDICGRPRLSGVAAGNREQHAGECLSRMRPARARAGGGAGTGAGAADSPGDARFAAEESHRVSARPMVNNMPLRGLC